MIFDVKHYVLFAITVAVQYLECRVLNSRYRGDANSEQSESGLAATYDGTSFTGSSVFGRRNFIPEKLPNVRVGESQFRFDDRTSDDRNANCTIRLAGQIEACLRGYENLVMTSSSTRLITSAGELSKLKRTTEGVRTIMNLCREYDQTMECLHDRLVNCPPDEAHRYLIAYRIGHVKTVMEQTCVNIDRLLMTSSTMTSPTTTVTVVLPSAPSTVVLVDPVSVPNRLYSSTSSRQLIALTPVDKPEVSTPEADTQPSHNSIATQQLSATRPFPWQQQQQQQAILAGATDSLRSGSSRTFPSPLTSRAVAAMTTTVTLLIRRYMRGISSICAL